MSYTIVVKHLFYCADCFLVVVFNQKIVHKCSISGYNDTFTKKINHVTLM